MIAGGVSESPAAIPALPLPLPLGYAEGWLGILAAALVAAAVMRAGIRVFFHGAG